MRKFTAFLLVLMFAGPMIVWACDCCPAIAPSTNPLPVLQAGHDCCPMMEVGGERCGLVKDDESLPALERFALMKITERGLGTASSFQTERPSSLDSSAGPPSFSFNAPLYLALQILRI